MDVLFLTGSSLSVNDNHPEVEALIKLVRLAKQKNESLKIIGFCFGHQFLTKAFHGKVIKKEKVAGI